jgi:hypothetical protein
MRTVGGIPDYSLRATYSKLVVYLIINMELLIALYKLNNRKSVLYLSKMIEKCCTRI